MRVSLPFLLLVFVAFVKFGDTHNEITKDRVLIRLCTSSAHTAQNIPNHTTELDPRCPHCGVTEVNLHGLVDCSSHADARRFHLPELIRSSVTPTDDLNIIHPTGSKQAHRSLRS